MEEYDHRVGTGYVPYKKGDYHDAIEKKKSKVHLLIHEAGLGGMSAYAARRPRRLARAAADTGDGKKTKYRRSLTAPSFLPLYAQRLSSACVMEGAQGILTSLKLASRGGLRRAHRAA